MPRKDHDNTTFTCQSQNAADRTPQNAKLRVEVCIILINFNKLTDNHLNDPVIKMIELNKPITMLRNVK